MDVSVYQMMVSCVQHANAPPHIYQIGSIPDCANITATLTRHANMLVGAGVDFVVADSTNLYMQGSFADAIQLRPFEVLLEEWLALRKEGITTPQATIWQNIQKPTGNLWESFVEVYKNPDYADLIYKDKATGKPVFFVTADPDPGKNYRVQESGSLYLALFVCPQQYVVDIRWCCQVLRYLAYGEQVKRA